MSASPSSNGQLLIVFSWIGNALLTGLALYLGLTHEGPLAPLTFLTIALAIILGNALPIAVHAINYLWTKSLIQGREAKAGELLSTALKRADEAVQRISSVADEASRTIIIARQIPDRLAEKSSALDQTARGIESAAKAFDPAALTRVAEALLAARTSLESVLAQAKAAATAAEAAAVSAARGAAEVQAAQAQGAQAEAGRLADLHQRIADQQSQLNALQHDLAEALRQRAAVEALGAKLDAAKPAPDPGLARLLPLVESLGTTQSAQVAQLQALDQSLGEVRAATDAKLEAIARLQSDFESMMGASSDAQSIALNQAATQFVALIEPLNTRLETLAQALTHLPSAPAAPAVVLAPPPAPASVSPVAATEVPEIAPAILAEPIPEPEPVPAPAPEPAAVLAPPPVELPPAPGESLEEAPELPEPMPARMERAPDAPAPVARPVQLELASTGESALAAKPKPVNNPPRPLPPLPPPPTEPVPDAPDLFTEFSLKDWADEALS